MIHIPSPMASSEVERAAQWWVDRMLHPPPGTEYLLQRLISYYDLIELKEKVDHKPPIPRERAQSDGYFYLILEATGEEQSVFRLKPDELSWMVKEYMLQKGVRILGTGKPGASSQWKSLKIHLFCERMEGFSIPEGREILVLVSSEDSAQLLSIGTEVRLKEIVQIREDCSHSTASYSVDNRVVFFRDRQYHILGRDGGEPLTTSPFQEKLVLDTGSQTVSVLQHGDVVFCIPYLDHSGDWVAATFSVDGNYIVVSSPYDFDFMVFQREEAAQPAEVARSN